MRLEGTGVLDPGWPVTLGGPQQSGRGTLEGGLDSLGQGEPGNLHSQQVPWEQVRLAGTTLRRMMGHWPGVPGRALHQPSAPGPRGHLLLEAEGEGEGVQPWGFFPPGYQTQH